MHLAVKALFIFDQLIYSFTFICIFINLAKCLHFLYVWSSVVSACHSKRKSQNPSPSGSSLWGQFISEDTLGHVWSFFSFYNWKRRRGMLMALGEQRPGMWLYYKTAERNERRQNYMKRHPSSWIRRVNTVRCSYYTKCSVPITVTGGGRNRVLLLNGYRILVMQDEKNSREMPHSIVFKVNTTIIVSKNLKCYISYFLPIKIRYENN